MDSHNHNGQTETVPDQQELVVLVKKLAQHLVYLEKKIDTLIEGRPGNSFNPNRRFPNRNRPEKPSAGYGARKENRGRPFFGGDQPTSFRHRKKRPFRQHKKHS